MADLPSGRYPQNAAVSALLGNLANSTVANVPARSNLEFPLGSLSDGALAATGVCAAVPIPIDPGTVVTKASLLIGGTAEATGTHGFIALYSGIATPALIVQTADDTGAASAAASAIYTRSFSAATLITAAMAPNGFIYASVSFTAGTIPTAASLGTPTAVGYQWVTNGPLFFAATHGSAVNGTAPATITSQSAKAVAPVVILQ
jgi:hypothetical protein